MGSRWRLSVPWIIALGLLATPAQAASLVLESLEFSEVSGDFTITGGQTTQDALRIFQDVTGPNIDLFMSIEGLRRERLLGFRLESVVTNRTDTPWVFFDHELQEQLGVPSPEEDGLSFAQGFAFARPTSDQFSTVDEVTDIRDFVNFTGGVINPNQTVTFRYLILDNSPNDLFFLRQRPNFAPGGVGVVAPPPPPQVPAAPAPPSTPPSPTAPPIVEAPVTPPPPPPEVISEQPLPAVKVPEPGVSIGLLSLMGMAWLRRRDH
ncbi:PEP-CTERM sorting domain-containing protein [Leptolyngbya sp. Heron Island J]|uniref:PEP-CTERM sorting domain-containing protein n=1 Tax=Leptolyngbya sp. Heron Island J TaxID=1385935 RepID=UPI00126844BD|nr:PEP-CTERM sorting domain-containing protein [Leptolyngbya sp. Heron Island J]